MPDLTRELPPSAAAARRQLHALASKARAKTSVSFFKTGPGQYGEDDQFIGVTVPNIRKIARGLRRLALDETAKLLTSAVHEERLLALIVLSDQYAKGGEQDRTLIYRLYLRRIKHVNNWDLVDSSAPHIVGAHLYERSRKPLYDLVQARLIWKRRIAIMATLHFIRKGDFGDTLALAKTLLQDDQDLIHKASGWMLREVGKRNLETLESFLDSYYPKMPRTMLRYAIERLPEARRKAYLRGTA
ncbi:MAG: DNA alkylation repair protein [Myxococcota bacterium]